MFDKKKVSIDFMLPEYKMLTDEAKKQNESNSSIVNNLVSQILSLLPEVKQSMSDYCNKQFMKTAEELNASKDTFSNQEKKIAMEQWKSLNEFFRTDVEERPTSTMRRIQLKDGYCIFPKDWIVLGDIEGKPEECMYAGVVESRNSSMYNIPHFIYFCNKKYGKDYTNEFDSAVYEECAKAFPDFKKFYNMQVDVTNADFKNKELTDKWNEAPCFGLFHLVVKGDPMYWNSSSPNYDPPAGAMIVRSNNETTENK